MGSVVQVRTSPVPRVCAVQLCRVCLLPAGVPAVSVPTQPRGEQALVLLVLASSRRNPPPPLAGQTGTAQTGEGEGGTDRSQLQLSCQWLVIDTREWRNTKDCPLPSSSNSLICYCDTGTGADIDFERARLQDVVSNQIANLPRRGSRERTLRHADIKDQTSDTRDQIDTDTGTESPE